MIPPAPPGDNAIAPGARTAAALSGPQRVRCRSFCFLERAGERWTVFLITYTREDGNWRGYFTFRSASVEAEEGEIRTADLFVEESESEVDGRARGLGRPLLLALLDSALETHERRQGYSPDVHSWLREMLAQSVNERRPAVSGSNTPTLTQLRSLYESYRLDQVAHLIALISPDDFREIVDILLDGRRVDFRTRDRFQFAMGIVQDLEKRLPLPPFELWAEDYVAHVDEYRRYTRALHSGGELP